MNGQVRQYRINANISSMEHKVVQHVRALQAHGWGRLEVVFEGGHVVACRRTTNDSPNDLRRLEEQDLTNGCE